MKDYQFVSDRKYLHRMMGDFSALAGSRRYELTDGKAKGIEAVDIKSGAGLEFTVLPGRGMDIAWASYKAVPVSFNAKTGLVAPAYYEHDGIQWLRSFFGGLLTTCGLSNVGPPSEQIHHFLGRQAHGLHGRISNTAAEHVSISESWQDNKLVISVSGKVKEAGAFGENLVLSRTIRTIAGENRLFLEDTIENLSPYESPVMLLYHINAGYPLLDGGSRFAAKSDRISAASPAAEARLKDYSIMDEPRTNVGELIYFHELAADQDNNAQAAVINPKLELGLYVKFNKKELPCFTQWKSGEEQDYAMGLEPGNCLPIGFAAAKEKDLLEMVGPFGQKTVKIEIGILEDQAAIEAFCLNGAC